MVKDRYYKENPVYEREKDDIESEKRLVESNRHLSFVYLKRFSSRSGLKLVKEEEKNKTKELGHRKTKPECNHNNEIEITHDCSYTKF